MPGDPIYRAAEETPGEVDVDGMRCPSWHDEPNYQPPKTTTELTFKLAEGVTGGLPIQAGHL